jgi:BirA family biotin operon repressor/biotin-[acetyl-CoA-carboxylase] ligase
MPGDTELVGVATDIDEHGRVVIVPESGDTTPVAVSAGDVTHLRALDA